MTPPAPDRLRRLARLCGVAEGYHDIWGVHRTVEPESLAAVLAAMGVGAETAADVEAEIAAREGAGEPPLCDPVCVVPDDGPQLLPLRLGPGEEDPVLELAGRNLPLVPEGDGPDGPARFRVSAPLARGIHDVRLRARRATAWRSASVRVAACPDRAHEPPALAGGGRGWGVNLALYAVRSGRNWGVGDLADLDAVVDWAADRGADLVGLLPLHALFNAPPHGVSPYYPSSRLFLNPLYIAVDRLPEAAAGPVAGWLGQARVREEIERLRGCELVDYAAAWAVKREALERCYRQFPAGDGDRARAFERWRAAQGPELEAFAGFCALRDRDPRPWGLWPEPLRRPDGAGARRFRQEHAEAVSFHAWLQWVAEGQLAAAHARARDRGMAVGLYLDVALGVDPWGADAWRFQDVLARGACAGAPPDPFSLLGQRWGVPPAVPERHRRDGYRLFLETLRRNARRAGAVRLDHVMALWRLFWVPDGLPPSRGTYVQDRAEELLPLLRLVSREEACLVVGEDLGTVPPEVRGALAGSGCYSYRVLIFEKDPDGRFRSPGEYPAQALVSASTHDLPPLDGFWLGRDLEVKGALGRYPDVEAEGSDAEGRRWDRQRLLEAVAREGLLPAGVEPGPEVDPGILDRLAAAVHGFLARAPSKLLLVSLDDLVGMAEMQNLPGTLDEHPNWRRRYPVPVEALDRSPRAEGIAAAVARERGAPRR